MNKAISLMMETNNWLIKAARTLDRVGIFSRWINTGGVTVLFFMILLTFIDVFMRYIFNSPIEGVYDFTSVMLIVVVYLGIAHTHNQKGHVAVDVITTRLSSKGRLVMDCITTILGIIIFAIVVWRSSAQLVYFIKTNAIHAQNIPIPSAPFGAIVVIGCVLLLLLLLRDLFVNISEGQRLKLGVFQWVLIAGVPVIAVALAEYWMQSTLWHLSGSIVGILGLIFCLVLLFTGMPIAFVLILTTFVFLAHIQGTASALNILGADLYRIPSSYTWAVIPFFVLMGYFCLFAKFSEDLYFAAYKWFGHMRGGLAIATISACTAFAAIVGSGLAPTVTMGTVALPEMKKYKYSDSLSTGSIVAGATLGPIIPPSTFFIIYAILTQQSIGRLFVAGIIPGLLLALIFTAVIYVRCRLDPGLGPPGLRATWRERIVSLKAGGPVVVLFLLVIGGLYAGIFTPIEAGAIGCAGALIFGLLIRRFTWRSFNNSLLGAGQTTAMCFLMLIGGILFSRFVAFCNLPDTLTGFITGLAVPSAVVIVVILLIFFILGFFVDVIPIILICVPVFHPIVEALGFDPIWFTVLAAIVIGVGTITPPVGINLFTLKGVAREIPMSVIYWGSLPFVVATLVVTVIVFMLPSLATWLPSLLY